MADDEKPTVTMKATQLHTYHGEEYVPGDTYEADEGDVTTIEVQGKGVRADADDDADDDAKDSATTKKPAAKPSSKKK